MSDPVPSYLDYATFIQPLNYEWKNLEREKEYPVPQGNLPMMKFLKPEKQLSLLIAYNEVMKK